MKKDFFSKLLVIVVTCIAACFFITQLNIYLNTEEIARSNLIEIIQAAKTETENKDYMDNNKSMLVFGNNKTLEFLSNALAGATSLETTAASACTWPLPSYYVGKENIGGNLTFVSSVQNRTFEFRLSGINSVYFQKYIRALSQVGELNGIECTNSPSYHEFTSPEPDIRTKFRLFIDLQMGNSSSEQSDIYDKENKIVILQNIHTLELLRGFIETSSFIGYDFEFQKTPDIKYYIGDTYAGGDKLLLFYYSGSNYEIVLPEPERDHFWKYIDTLIESKSSLSQNNNSRIQKSKN